MHDAAVGDPYLDLYRARFLLRLDRNSEAKAAAERLVVAEPQDKAGYLVSARVSAKMRDYAAVAERIKMAIEKSLVGLQPAVLDLETDGTAFVFTKEFAELKKWYYSRSKK